MIDRLSLIQILNGIPQEQLLQIIFTLNLPKGIIPLNSASQGQQVFALLQWAESPAGCSLEQVQAVLDTIIKPPNHSNSSSTQVQPQPTLNSDQSVKQLLRKESLATRLDRYQKDYRDLERDYQGAGDADEKNRLQSKLDRKLEEIENTQKELKQIEQSEYKEQKLKLISILNHFEQYNDLLQKAYLISLPARCIERELPQSPEKIVSKLEFLLQDETNYTCLEKFVGNLWLSSKDLNLSEPVKENLKEWIQKNIKNYRDLITQLEQENQERNKKYNPCLLVAISDRENNYVIEAWLIKNLDQYNRESALDCQQLIINNPLADKDLTDVEKVLREKIQECINNLGKAPQQIHIFLPYKLMNHSVDCWKTYEDEDETIGEQYEVILRCSEGLRGKDPRIISWQNKGLLLRSKLQELAQNIFILGDSKEEKTLEKNLRQANALAVTITTVFQQKQPGTLLWKSSVPLALWIRQELNQTDNKGELNDLVTNCCLQTLPYKVKHRRLEAMDKTPPEAHVGRHLCLLWDDPNLLPPEQLLTESKL